VTQLNILRTFLIEETNIHSAHGKIKRKGGEQMLQNIPGKDLALVYKELDMFVYFLFSGNNLRNKWWRLHKLQKRQEKLC